MEQLAKLFIHIRAKIILVNIEIGLAECQIRINGAELLTAA